jgi:hypothetical protein
METTMSVTREVLQGLERDAFIRFTENARRLERNGPAPQSKAAREALALIETIPEDSRVEIAFRGTKVSAKERKLIRVLDENPGATAAKLTSAMGWKSQSWQTQFGAMCRDRLALFIDPPASEDESEQADTNFYANLLASYDASTQGFTLRPETREALVRTGLLDAA